MSGGHFDYKQHYIQDIIDEFEHALSACHFEENTRHKIMDGIRCLKQAYVHAHRLDWLISGDDDEEAYHKRLQEELDAI